MVFRTIAEPSFRASTTDKADYVELQTLAAADGTYSLADFTADVRRSGSFELADEDDPDSDGTLVDPAGEESEALSNEVYSECDDRLVSCGGGYPFEVEADYLMRKKDASRLPYTFMLLLSLLGNVAPDGLDATKVFEDLAAEAARSYFGGALSTVGVYKFGAPRRETAAGFRDAIDGLCRELGEGNACRPHPTLRDQQDAKLDVVAWRRFPDRRAGQLIGFGQCATGKNWKDKLTELNAVGFCKSWLRDSPAVDPLTLFFVPFRLHRDSWLPLVNSAGIIFDRCRLAHHLVNADAGVLDLCQHWSSYVLRNEMGIEI